MNSVIYKERKNTDSMKWDGCAEKFGREDLLPLWVADMDFEIPACVKDALREYVDFGVMGYYRKPAGYDEAFIAWEEKYHGYRVKAEWMRYAPGVVPAFNWLIHILTQEGDAVIILSPVYYPFHDAIVNNGRRLVESPLVRVREEHRYEIDYADFERKIVEHDVKAFIFCSPHNPVGRVWKEDELRRVLDICKKHGVYVISDEIHQDILMPGVRQIPAATVGEYDDILITVTAATKTFNLAACQNSILVIPDEGLRGRYDGYLKRLRLNGGNSFGYIAVQSAYEGGRPWLEEVLAIVEDNYRLMRAILEERLPKVWISDLEGTYLMWIDLGSYVRPGEIEHVIRDLCGLAVDYGSWFGGEENAGFIRINLATKRENIEQAARSIADVLGNEPAKLLDTD